MCRLKVMNLSLSSNENVEIKVFSVFFNVWNWKKKNTK